MLNSIVNCLDYGIPFTFFKCWISPGNTAYNIIQCQVKYVAVYDYIQLLYQEVFYLSWVREHQVLIITDSHCSCLCTRCHLPCSLLVGHILDYDKSSTQPTNRLHRRYPRQSPKLLYTPKHPQIDNFFMIKVLNTSLRHLVPSVLMCINAAKEQTLIYYYFHIFKDLWTGEKHINVTSKLIFDSIQHFTTLSFHFKFRFNLSGPEFPFIHRSDATILQLHIKSYFLQFIRWEACFLSNATASNIILSHITCK